MDPNETLKRIDEFLREHRTGEEVDHWCEDLLEWLDRGGFEPDWEKYSVGTSYFECRRVQAQRNK